MRVLAPSSEVIYAVYCMETLDTSYGEHHHFLLLVRRRVEVDLPSVERLQRPRIFFCILHITGHRPEPRCKGHIS